MMPPHLEMLEGCVKATEHASAGELDEHGALTHDGGRLVMV